MSRLLRVVLAVAPAAVALLALRVALDEVYLEYLLPSPHGARHLRQVFPPGVVAAVVAGLVALATLVWLVLSMLTRPARSLGWVVLTLVVLDVVVLSVVSQLPHPAF